MAFNPFLKQVAEQLWERFGDKLETLTVVLPTRRARLYFALYLAAVIDKPVWQPRYLGMEELMASRSQLKQVDQYRLLVELYRVYCTHKESDETFDHFYFWGEAMLNDFDSIDKYRVNAQSLFANLADQKELEGDYSFLEEKQVELVQSFWDTFEPNKASRLQESFVEVWDILYPTYRDFKKRLTAKGIAYEGMIMRTLTEELEDASFTDEFDGTYVFVGLNALNECEKSLLSYLQRKEKALFYWDYDTYYLNNPQQEAGSFIRENIKRFPPEPLPDTFTSFSSPKSIELIASTGDVMQAKLIPQLLEELGTTDSPVPNYTAIVPADERLLVPLLYALPQDTNVNITMGYPLAQTPVFTLAELLIKLQRGRKESSKGASSYYHKDVQGVLNHPYVRRLTGSEGDELLDRIAKYNLVYVGMTQLATTDFLKLLFSPVGSYTEMTDYLTQTLTRIAEAELDDNAPLRREYAYYFITALRQLKKAISDEEMDISLPIYLSLLRMAIRSIRIPFSGEPLQGTQVMGILETRALDFENVIMLSLNEGTLPQARSSISFIPYNLRRGFGIPNADQYEAIYAYYFYRMLQRAKNIRLLYSTKADEGSTGEMSRYLQQLKMESGHQVLERTVTYSIDIETQRIITATKTDEVMQKLAARAESGLSPSAISTYIACPMQFYFKYILNLRETEEVEEDVSMTSFGNILHSAVEQLYRPYVDKTLDLATIKALRFNDELVKQKVDNAFAQAYFKSDRLPSDFEQNGKLAIVRDVVLRYVKGVLQHDMSKAPFVVRMLEEQLRIPYSVDVRGASQPLYLKGIIDRVDEVDGTIHIVDYKTGRSKREFKGLDALFADTSDKQNSAVLQTFLYALMYEAAFGASKAVTPTLYFVRDVFSNSFNHLIVERVSRTEQVEVQDFSHYRSEFTLRLNQTLATLFDREQSFVQTTDLQVCKTYCPFAMICNR